MALLFAQAIADKVNGMSLLDSLAATFAPHDCLGCGAEGALACPACRSRLQVLPERCYRCKKLSAGNRTCVSCRSSSALYSVRAATVYDGLARDLVWRLKFHGAQAAAREIAECLLPLQVAETVLITHVPTATSRVRQRGYDQAALIARSLSRRTGMRFIPLLSRRGQHHQVGANPEQRVTQLAAAFRVARPALVRGAHVLLVDDVLTTGATMEAAAKALKAAGATRVESVVFAQA